MNKFLNKFNIIIEKIGKRNLLLIVFVFVVLCITGLYQTFSLYTESGGMTLVNGIKTYTFILSASNDTNSVTIASGSTKNIDITVSNESEAILKYGLYYSSDADLSGVSIGYLESSTHEPNGIINGNGDYVVSLRVKNNSSSAIVIDFGIKYGFNNEEELVLNTNESWLDLFQEVSLLSDVSPGSYVLFKGNNLNTGTNVSGGYCHDSNYTYDYSGWRVAYVDNDVAHLVTGGVPECMEATGSSTTSGFVDNVALDNPTSTTETWSQSTMSNRFYYGSTYSFDASTGTYSLGGTTGTITVSYGSTTVDYSSKPYTCKSTTSAAATCTTIYKVTNATKTSNYSTSANFTASSYSNEGTVNTEGESASDFIIRLNSAALPYCNTIFAYNAACNSNSAWVINGTDYNRITGVTFTNGSNAVSDNKNIIGNGGFYWFANSFSTTNLYLWDPANNYINNNIEITNSLGLRPIVKLSSSIYVTGGSGTIDDPYTIGINDAVSSETVAAGDMETVTITVSNDSNVALLYDVFYSSTSDLTNVDIGYKSNTVDLPTGTIGGASNKTITVIIDNKSNESVTVDFGTKFRFENGGEVELDAGENWLLEYSGYVFLADVEPGSYVTYVGSNGSTGANVSGGYCHNSSYTYDYSGWRVAYSNGGSAHLISGGAVECLAATAGTSSTSYVDTIETNSPTSTTETWTQSSYMATYRYYIGLYRIMKELTESFPEHCNG